MRQLKYDIYSEKIILEDLKYWLDEDDIPKHIKDFFYEECDKFVLKDKETNDLYCPKCGNKLEKDFCKDCQKNYLIKNTNFNEVNIKELKKYKFNNYYFVFDVVDKEVIIYLINIFITYDNPLTNNPFRSIYLRVENAYHVLKDCLINLKQKDKIYFFKELDSNILYEEYFNMSTYVHTGKVVPIDDIITEEIRNDIDDSYWDISTLNGKTYMMPYLGMQNTLCYNKELFKQAGLEKYITDEDVIQNWSLEDWEVILSNLHSKLPSNKYTMLMYGKNEIGDTHVITLLRSRGSTFFDENGRVKLTTPEGIKAVQWLMDCNKKGYFPANAESLEINDCYELFTNGQLAIYINNAVLDSSISQSGINYGHVNFPSVDGKGFNTTFLTGFEVFDNGDEEKLKVAKDFIKFIYETEELLDYSAGAIPCSNKVALKYADVLKDKQKYIDNNKQGWNFTGNVPEWRKVREVFYKDVRELLYGEKTAEEIAKQIEDDCNKAINEGYAESKLHE